MRTRSIFGWFAVLSSATIALIWWSVPVDNERVMQDFMYGQWRMESELMDPLQKAGPTILPTVLAAIKDKNMPRRRYAILFIERQRHEPALPFLETVVKDESEKIYFRGDALSAIYAISPETAQILALDYVDAPDWLGRYARNIRDGRPLLTLN